MITFIPFGVYAASNISDLIRLKDSDTISVIGMLSDVLFVASNAEFSKMFVHNGANLSRQKANYRISNEVFRLLLSSPQFDWNVDNDTLYLCFEEVQDKDNQDLLIYFQTFRQDVLQNEILLDRARVERRTLQEALSEIPETINVLHVAKSVDYMVNLIGTWYAANRTSGVKKYPFYFAAYMREMVEVSKVFRTGVCVKDGLFYSDSSKIAIQVYKQTGYDGPPMLLSDACVSVLEDFIGKDPGTVMLFYIGEYTAVRSSFNTILLWKTLRFDSEPDMDELRKQQYCAVFEYEPKVFQNIFRNIAVTKVSQITCDIKFYKSELVIKDGSKGIYRFFLDGYQIRNEKPISTSYALDVRVMKSIFGLKMGYNRIRIFVYDYFFRIDFVNAVEDEYGDEEETIDVSNRLTVIFGRCD